MRRIRYAVSASLDGYIAGPKGEADWITMDPDIDFGAIFNQFDTLLVGRRTFESMAHGGDSATMPGMKTFVFSRTLQQSDYRDVTIVGEKFKETLTALRKQPGKDIWLFGGGELFRSLAEAKLVDTVEVAVVPVLLGGGIPLLLSQNDNVRFRQSRNVRFCAKWKHEDHGTPKYCVPFIERPVFAPLRQSQAFSQTLVVGLAESLTLSSLRQKCAATMKGTFLFW